MRQVLQKQPGSNTARLLATSIIGLALIAFGLVTSWQSSQKPAVYAEAYTAETQLSQQSLALATPKVAPVRVLSEAVGLNTEVQAATVDNNNHLSLVSGIAEYVDIPALNLATGSGYIYGHNRNDELKLISKLKPGNQVVIVGSDGGRYVFRMASSEIVPETAIHKINDAADMQQMVLQTCTGFRSTQRLLVYLELVEVQTT